MPFINSNRPYTPSELVNKISNDENVNERSAKRQITGLLNNGSLQKHTVNVTICGREYKMVLYQYLGLYTILMTYALNMVVI